MIRWCRAITKRSKILVFHGCYHGAADDTFVRLKNGKAIHRPGLLGQVFDVTQFTKIVEFNDLSALESALAEGDVACVLTEPALTNIGMVLPEPGFLEALRVLARKHGTLLVIDETHTISTGYGGYTRTHGLEPDFLIVASRSPAVFPARSSASRRRSRPRMRQVEAEDEPGYSGMGTTLSANAMALHAMRANLEEVMTPAAYDHMLPLSERLARGIEARIKAHGLPWHVSNVGARAEFVCAPNRPKNGTEAQAAMHHARGVGDPPLSAEPRLHHRPLPQYDPGQPGDQRRTGRPADRDGRSLLRRIAGRIGRLNTIMSKLVADIAEARGFLDKNPDIEFIQLVFTNQSGVPRGKNLRRHDLLPIYEHGRYLPGTMLALDITGEDVEESGLVWTNGDADYLGKPIPGTLVQAPWLGANFAQVMLSVYELDGSPCPYDPRHVLQRVIDRFTEFDLTPVVACELEFYLLDRDRGPSGEVRVPASPSPATGRGISRPMACASWTNSTRFSAISTPPATRRASRSRPRFRNTRPASWR